MTINIKNIKHGSLAKRATDAGYCRYRRRFKTAHSQSSLIATGKTLSFYMGQPPHGQRTEWTMNEYHLDPKESETRAGLEVLFGHGVGPCVIESYI